MGKLGKLIAAGWMNSCFLILWSWDSVKWRPQGATGDVEFKLKWITKWEKERRSLAESDLSAFMILDLQFIVLSFTKRL